MNNIVVKNIWRLIGLLLLQVLVFKRVQFGFGLLSQVNIFIYPLFLFMLPINISRALLILLGFALGITVDIFYYSPGLHASACTFIGFFRPWLISVLEPRGGYKVNTIPTKSALGMNWFIRYSVTLLVLHLFIYFLMEAFAVTLILNVLIKTVLSFVFSYFMIIFYVSIFNPKY